MNLAKLFFHALLQKDRELKRKLEELDTVHAALFSIGGVDYSKDRVDGGVPRDMADKMSRLMQIKAEANAQQDAVIAMRDTAERIIKLLPDQQQRSLLWERYILGLTWERVASNIHQSLRWVHRLEVRAFRELNDSHEEILKEATSSHLRPL